MSQKSVRRIRTEARALLTDETIRETTKSLREGMQVELKRLQKQYVLWIRVSLFFNVVFAAVLVYLLCV